MEISPFMRISEGAINRYHAVMERVWDGRLFSEQLWEATKAFLQSEQAFRSAGLAEKLDLPQKTRDYYGSQERIHNDLGIVHLVAARGSLEAFMRTKSFPESGDLYFPEYEAELEYAQLSFLERVVEIGLSPDEAKEIVDEYGKKIGIALQGGRSGLIAGVIRDIGMLTDYRRKETRGRELGSQLPIWKMLFIDAVIGAAIAGIIVLLQTGERPSFSRWADGASGWAALFVTLGC